MGIKGALKALLPLSLKRDLAYIGWKNILLYFFMQRVLGINSQVPWPVHWSSIVSYPDHITRKYWRPYPGYMPGQYIQARNGIIIGRNVRMGPGVKLISANHNLCNYDVHNEANPIEIGDNCWLGSDVIILPGVALGEHVVVAAGAVVTKSFPDNCLIGGVPARVLKSLGVYVGLSNW
jgi:hypothetical protein